LAQQLAITHTRFPAIPRLLKKPQERPEARETAPRFPVSDLKQRWFRRGQGWRAGIEARLSTLKHRFGIQRALYKGEIGFERHVAWCIIAHNLVI
jgi:hypothetical protein